MSPSSPIQIFDPPMCCPSGVCGPVVDPDLTRFAADLAWLAAQGVQVERFNLAQQPQAFANHPDVRAVVALAERYLRQPATVAAASQGAKRGLLPMLQADEGGCTPGSGCC